MLKFLSIVLLTFTTGLAIVQAADGEANRQKLIVGTREAPPFAMKDDAGVWTGLSIELWEDVAQDLGMAYELREMGEPETLIDGVSDGTIDVSIAAITVTAERAERVDFSQPYYTAGFGIVVPRTQGGGWWSTLSAFFSWDFLKVVGGNDDHRGLWRQITPHLGRAAGGIGLDVCERDHHLRVHRADCRVAHG